MGSSRSAPSRGDDDVAVDVAVEVAVAPAGPDALRTGAGDERSQAIIAGVGVSRAALVLAALAPAAMLAVDPAGWSPFTPAKWLVVTTLVLIGTGLALGHRPTRLHRASLVAFAVFVGWAAVSAAFGMDRLYAWIGTPERHLGVLAWALCSLAFVAGQTVRRAVDLVTVLTGVVVAGCGVGGYGAVEWLWRAPIALDAVTSRLGGPFGSAAYLGAACTLLVPVQVGIAVERQVPRWLRGAAVVGGGLSSVVLVGSGTRGAWLALMAAMALVVLLRAGWRRAVVALGALAALVALLTLVPGVRQVATRQGGAEGAARLDEWRVGARIALANPVVGAGPEGYRIAFPSAVDARYERAHGRAETPDRAHDVVLDLAATLGLPGLLAYGVLIVVVGRKVVAGLRRAPPWRAGLCVALVAYLAQQAVLFPLAELEPVAWLLAGIVVAWESHPREGVTVVVARPWRAALVVLGALALAAGVADVLADRAARTALRTPRPSTAVAERAARLRPDALRYRLVAARASADPAEARRQIDAARRLSPGDPIARIEQARVVGTLAAWRDVTDHDPVNAAAWLRRGVAAAEAGDDADAERSWLRAEDLAPLSPVPAIDLTRLYLQLGRVADARDAARRALARAPHDADALAAAADVDRAMG